MNIKNDLPFGIASIKTKTFQMSNRTSSPSQSNSCFNTPVNNSSCEYIGIPCAAIGLQIAISSLHDIT